MGGQLFLHGKQSEEFGNGGEVEVGEGKAQQADEPSPLVSPKTAAVAAVPDGTTSYLASSLPS